VSEPWNFTEAQRRQFREAQAEAQQDRRTRGKLDARDKQLAADRHIMTMTDRELRAVLMGLNARQPEAVLDEIEQVLDITRAS